MNFQPNRKSTFSEPVNSGQNRKFFTHVMRVAGMEIKGLCVSAPVLVSSAHALVSFQRFALVSVSELRCSARSVLVDLCSFLERFDIAKYLI